nr:cysteine-rich CWC family protein [Limnohabitans sp. Rim47]
MATPATTAGAVAVAVAVAVAAAPGPCWCTRGHFSAELLKQVPEAARNKACICAACARASKGKLDGDNT